MPVTPIAVRFKVDGERIVQVLREAGEKISDANGDLVLDFSSVHRIGTKALMELERLASMADDKVVKVVLRGVNVDVYKVLKVMKLAERFSFLADARERSEGEHVPQV